MKLPESAIDENHRDFKVLDEVHALLHTASQIGARQGLENEIPLLLRQGLWEVIDTPRTARIWVSELEKTEKTYIGTKIEILIRDYFGFPKGKLDMRIGHHDVDVKNTVRQNWMIPSEAVGEVCMLCAEDDRDASCWFGLIVARPEYLNPGKNKDAKRSITRAELRNVLWLIADGPMPENFWSGIAEADIAQIMDSRCSGAERLHRLFATVRDVPISREVVKGVARQQDYMKRLRKNGGARDTLAREKIVLLSGNYDAELIRQLKLSHCEASEFISHHAASAREIRILRDKWGNA